MLQSKVWSQTAAATSPESVGNGDSWFTSQTSVWCWWRFTAMAMQGYKLPSFPWRPVKRVGPIPPTLPDHRASRSPSPPAESEGQVKVILPVWMCQLSVSASNFLQWLPLLNQPAHQVTHQSIALRPSEGVLGPFISQAPPSASWINSDNLSHPYRHTSKCGPMRTGKGQDRKEEGTNQRTTPSALRGQTLFPLASRMQHLRLFSLLCVLSSPSLFKQTHFKCQWVTVGPSQPGGDQIAKGSDLCGKVASRETRDPAPCREWRIHEWLKWAFVVLTRAP